MAQPACLRENVPLKSYSTLRIGGMARYLAEPASEAEIATLLAWAAECRLPWCVIGHGSNILFDDAGYPGLVIHLGQRFARLRIDGSRLTVQAGAWMPHVARRSQQAGLSGLEHTIGIPGNIGGILAMNAGSRRQNIASSLERVRYIDASGRIASLGASEAAFGYRQSIFRQRPWIILDAAFALQPAEPAAIRHEMLAILRDRRGKFPRKQPNCGSVFKSDPALYARLGPPGRIIESLGLKGAACGDLRISPRHANFFVNLGQARASDFRCLLNQVKQAAQARYGIDLQEEVIDIGTPHP